ncbi:MAG: sulfurtransferase TusA family protein [Bacteroidales bacterium]|nr:sulfurtransferase TusA family protein [Bacteroidales bacterium]
MKIIDTRKEKELHPLIIALEAYFSLKKEEQIEIIFVSRKNFSHLKDYLSKREIGFREIYSGDEMRLQIQKKD